MNSLNELIEKEDLVAHYTKRDTAIDFIFKSEKIKISSLENLNDPYESKKAWIEFGSYVTKFEGKEEIKLENELKRKEIRLKEIIGKQIKFFCVTQKSKAKNQFPTTIDIYSHPSMWSHYGDNHKGICLLFSRAKLDDYIKNYSANFRIESKAISYVPFTPIQWIDGEKVDLCSENTKQLFEDINLDNLKIKQPHWEYESEYRWIVCSKKDDELYVPYEDSLKAVVLGINFNLDYLPKLKAQIKDVPIYILVYDLGNYYVNLA